MKKYYLLFLSAFSGIYNLSLAQPTQPPAPLNCNAENCTPPVSETCSGNSTVVTNFINATLRSGSPTSLPALYTFYNIANVDGQQINATVTVESKLNCAMDGTNFVIDDDIATDQAGNSMTSFFAPRITPDIDLGTADRRGYVQFTIHFYIENTIAGQQYPGDYTTLPAGGGLQGLNYIHYDIDGSTVGTGGWFRETGVVRNVNGSLINADATTELAPYSYTDGVNWKGFAGSVCERTGVSRCAQVAVAATYSTPQSEITFRMGYDYNRTTTNYGYAPTRQYGSRFGCFSFPSVIPLSVKLSNFTAMRTSDRVNLAWTTASETNNRGFYIIRQNGNNGWQVMGYVPSAAFEGNSNVDISYSFTDINSLGGVTQYRLQHVDFDNSITYSDIRMVKGMDQTGKLLVFPNPSPDHNLSIVLDNMGTDLNVRMIDMNGRLVKEWNNVTNGKIFVGEVTSGMYTLRVWERNTGQVQHLKVIVSK